MDLSVFLTTLTSRLHAAAAYFESSHDICRSREDLVQDGMMAIIELYNTGKLAAATNPESFALKVFKDRLRDLTKAADTEKRQYIKIDLSEAAGVVGIDYIARLQSRLYVESLLDLLRPEDVAVLHAFLEPTEALVCAAASDAMAKSSRPRKSKKKYYYVPQVVIRPRHVAKELGMSLQAVRDTLSRCRPFIQTALAA